MAYPILHATLFHMDTHALSLSHTTLHSVEVATKYIDPHNTHELHLTCRKYLAQSVQHDQVLHGPGLRCGTLNYR